MRIIKINNEIIDIDDDTAIGITYQAYDIKEPGKRKINISNNFTIPITANNYKIIGFAGNPYSICTDVYDDMYIDYWINDEKVLDQAKVKVTEVSERINLYVFQKDDIWDLIKQFSYADFVDEYLTWLQDEKSIPSQAIPYVGNFSGFLNLYLDSTTHLICPMMFGNLYQLDHEDDGTFLEDTGTIRLNYWPNTESNQVNGGHWCAYTKSIFEFIEYKYGVNLCVNEVGITGNIWDDAYAPVTYFPLRTIDIEFTLSPGVTEVYFVNRANPLYSPYDDLQFCEDKSLYDLVNVFFQHFNIIKDDITISNEPAIRLSRFDDITTMADIINFSGGLSGIPKFKPYIENFGQNNYIKFSSIYKEGSSTVNSKLLTCLNKNIEAVKDLFQINAYIPAFVAITGGVVPDMSYEESFKDFTLLISDGITSASIAIKASQNQATEESASYQMYKAALYSLDSEYELINSLIKYPRFYEIQKWLTINDIRNIEYFKQYYIQELNGAYFINKISGFNPERSNEPTTLEVFKISDNVAIDFKELVYYTDGTFDDFTDGLGNEFF